MCHNIYHTILYIKAIVSICLSVFYLSFIYFFFSDVISLSLSFWYNPIGSRSLWSVLGGGGRESPVKHEGRGGGGHGRRRTGRGGGHGRGRTGRRGGTNGEGLGKVGGTGEEGPGEGKLDRCIMHHVHTSM
jgi:hypothetical protein